MQIKVGVATMKAIVKTTPLQKRELYNLLHTSILLSCGFRCRYRMTVWIAITTEILGSIPILD